MRQQQIAKWLEAIGTSEASIGGEWVQAHCPFAVLRHENGTDTTPSFGVKVQDGDSRCHCFSCDYSGTQTDVVMDLRADGIAVDFQTAMVLIVEAEEDAPIGLEDGDYEDDLFGESEPDHIYADWFLDAFEPAYSDGAVHPYLEKRGVDFYTAHMWDLRYDMFRQRICFPVRDWQGSLRGIHGRDVTNNSEVPWLMYPFQGQTNPHVWLGEHRLVEEVEPVIIAEAAFDLIRCWQAWPNVLSPLRASLSSRQLARIQPLNYIVTVFDPDKAGDNARKRLHQSLPDTKIVDVILDAKTDAADYSVEEMKQILDPYL